MEKTEDMGKTRNAELFYFLFLFQLSYKYGFAHIKIDETMTATDDADVDSARLSTQVIIVNFCSTEKNNNKTWN